MRQGKVSESILKRSVLKTIKYKSNRITDKPAPGNDGAVAHYEEATDVILTSAVGGLYGSEEHLLFHLRMALFGAINNMYAKAGIPEAVMVSLILPAGKLESDLRGIMGAITKMCVPLKLEVAGGNTEVSKNVRTPIVEFTVLGHRNPAFPGNDIPCKPGMQIVMSKEIGLMGTAIMVCECQERLEERFSRSYVKSASDIQDNLLIRTESLTAVSHGVTCMHDLGRGGIFAALWELAQITECGVEAVISKMPVRQETIEFGEYFSLNPYKMISGGSLLMVTEDGEALVRALGEAGVSSAVIGQLTDNNDKVVIQNEERRFIEPPKGDEIFKAIG